MTCKILCLNYCVKRRLWTPNTQSISGTAQNGTFSFPQMRLGTHLPEKIIIFMVFSSGCTYTLLFPLCMCSKHLCTGRVVVEWLILWNVYWRMGQTQLLRRMHMMQTPSLGPLLQGAGKNTTTAYMFPACWAHSICPPTTILKWDSLTLKIIYSKNGKF